MSVFHEQNVSARAIAKRIKRSKDVVLNCIKSREQYGTTKRSGRQPKMSAQDKRLLLVEASKRQSSA